MKKLALTFLFACCLPSCGETPGEGVIVENVVPVNGIATYQGKPLEDYTIYVGSSNDRPAYGKIDGEGHFELSTNETGDGAPAGSNSVWFSYTPEIEGTPGQEQIDPKIPAPKVKLPRKYASPKTSNIKMEIPADGLKDYKLEIK